VLTAAATVTARSLDAAAAAGAGGCWRISPADDGAATRGFLQHLIHSHASLSIILYLFAVEATTASSGVYRRLKQSRVRRLGMARRRL
jgi:hypothetical protein